MGKQEFYAWTFSYRLFILPEAFFISPLIKSSKHKKGGRARIACRVFQSQPQSTNKEGTLSFFNCTHDAKQKVVSVGIRIELNALLEDRERGRPKSFGRSWLPVFHA